MTAEIAILNRNGVALAADSAGTLLLPSGPKITHTESKLFMLSKYAPVGIMVYGASQLMGVPWETIIKTYRQDLKAKAFEHLEDYVTDFVSFVEREELLFPRDLQSSYGASLVEDGFVKIKANLDEQGKCLNSPGEAPNNEKVKSAGRTESSIVLEQVEKSEYLRGFGPDDVDRFAKDPQVAAMINAVLERVIGKLPTTGLLRRFQRAGALMLCNQYASPDISGVVVAGFGEREVFPALVHLQCDGVVNRKCRHIEVDKVRIETDFGDGITSAIRPFAQHEMVDRFMEGIDPQYRKFVDECVSAWLLDKYANSITEFLNGKIAKDVQEALNVRLTEIVANLKREFTETLDQYQGKEFVDGITRSVATLPKQDLAAMAEALVNLTAFKRKVTSDQPETVAGPIDVAVISKGDGFIWIKKKHYFEASLNPDFFSNYCRKDII